MARRKKNGDRFLCLLELPGVARYSKGHAQTLRVQSSVAFIIVRDKTGTVQCVVEKSYPCFEMVKLLTVESVVEITGAAPWTRGNISVPWPNTYNTIRCVVINPRNIFGIYFLLEQFCFIISAICWFFAISRADGMAHGSHSRLVCPV